MGDDDNRIDLERIGESLPSDPASDVHELSTQDNCPELIDRARRGMNTVPGPDEDVVRRIRDVEVPDEVREIRRER